MRPVRAIVVGGTGSGLRLLDHLRSLPALEIVGVVGFSPRHAAGVSGYADVAAHAENLGLRAIRVDRNINDVPVVEQITASSPDVVFVLAWPQLLRPPLLRAARLGVIGRHNAMLPARRGRAPVAWALIHGLAETGVSFFWMDEGVDSGDLIAQAPVPIGADDYPTDVIARLEAASATLLEQIVARLAAGDVPRHAQDHGRASYTHPRRPDMGLIDWGQSAAQVHNFIRGLSRPYPGAFTYLRTQRVNVWRSEISSAGSASDRVAPAGTVIAASGAPLIQTGRGAVRLCEYAGPSLCPGERLGCHPPC